MSNRNRHSYKYKGIVTFTDEKFISIRRRNDTNVSKSGTNFNKKLVGSRPNGDGLIERWEYKRYKWVCEKCGIELETKAFKPPPVYHKRYEDSCNEIMIKNVMLE